MPLAIGTKAPAFHLHNTDRRVVTLADFAGKPLLIQFFPAAFTGVCTEQVCKSRDDAQFYNDLGVTVVGISVDSPFTLKEFKERNQVHYDLLSDFNKTSIHDYDMYLPNFALGMKGVAKRGVALIDSDGNIAYTEETASPGTQVNFAALNDALKKLKK